MNGCEPADDLQQDVQKHFEPSLDRTRVIVSRLNVENVVKSPIIDVIRAMCTSPPDTAERSVHIDYCKSLRC